MRDNKCLQETNNLKEENNMKLNLAMLKETNEVFKRLNILRRWTSFVTEDKYNELAKQSLNCITAYMLATYSEKDGITVKWERFPKIALYRAFQKAYVYFDTPEHIMDEICKIGNIKKSEFNKVTEEIIAENAGKQFADFLCEGIGTYEFQIYRAATKIATYVELVENSNKMRSEEQRIKVQEIIKSLEEFEGIPGVNEIYLNTQGGIFKLLEKLSSLRNRNRWAAQAYSVECSVLGHLFDTAVFAYFMSLEKDPENEVTATKMFFMGIFHDVAEAWTTDIPSPIKDRIRGFRAATEKYELEVLEKNLYKNVPEFLAKKLKEVMFEDEANVKYKKLLKGADYLSADSECWRQYKAGTRDEYFLGAINRRRPKIESGDVLLTPVCGKLYKEFYEYATSLKL